MTFTQTYPQVILLYKYTGQKGSVNDCNQF